MYSYATSNKSCDLFFFQCIKMIIYYYSGGIIMTIIYYIQRITMIIIIIIISTFTIIIRLLKIGYIETGTQKCLMRELVPS